MFVNKHKTGKNVFFSFGLGVKKLSSQLAFISDGDQRAAVTFGQLATWASLKKS